MWRLTRGIQVKNDPLTLRVGLLVCHILCADSS